MNVAQGSGGSDAEGIIDVEGLNAGYGSMHVLHSVSMAVSARERVGLVGLNGHGKTTLLRALIGATGWQRTSGRSACSMAAISPDSQARLPASLRQIWCCRSGRIACLVPCWRTAGDNSLPFRLFRT